MNRVLVCCAAALMLAACSTTAPRPDQVRTPPAERVMLFQDPSAGDATIVVTRDVGFTGSGCYGAVFVDGQVAAKLGRGERVKFYVPAGDHILGTWNTGEGLCGYHEGKERKEVSVALRKGEERKFRIAINPNAGVDLMPTTLD